MKSALTIQQINEFTKTFSVTCLSLKYHNKREKLLWRCGVCGHEWEKAFWKIRYSIRKRGCNGCYCCAKKKLGQALGIWKKTNKLLPIEEKNKTRASGWHWHKDLTGASIEGLTVLKLFRLTDQGVPIWECKCVCGNYENIPHRKLLDRKHKYCSICATRRSSKLIDMIGKQSGYLTVIKRHGKSHDGSTWLCQCLCGNQSIVSGNALRRQTIRSCGCANAITAMGTRFGSYLEAVFFIRYTLAGVSFLHNKEYGKELGKKRFDFYLTQENRYIEVSSFCSSFLEWDKYIQGIEKKKDYVENKLLAHFEFVNRKCTGEEYALVNKYLDRKQELPPKAISKEELSQQLITNNRTIISLVKEYRTSPRRLCNLSRKYGLQSSHQKKRNRSPKTGIPYS